MLLHLVEFLIVERATHLQPQDVKGACLSVKDLVNLSGLSQLKLLGGKTGTPLMIHHCGPISRWNSIRAPRYRCRPMQPSSPTCVTCWAEEPQKCNSGWLYYRSAQRML